ncbi:hypothetical protein GCM10010168_09780 [Actinoplanes ianthinogenes]|uniref:DUF4232 domain-containing protein n=1 Tax=Actinoplanes ianthinogenes TaxID=122358 RepID=A0ABN6CEZ3_9ACTN|nr:DUF4232 domain-containing protein [Actinoplanes ianthinogenes]BCJ44165.1 hypothetical protein Aiant_48220 [Actinoplanes ianthinogenes]GGQ96193.1 hypothetical protein GCM10010168_09780 [Actinoplanes ianthinogenes]
MNWRPVLAVPAVAVAALVALTACKQDTVAAPAAPAASTTPTAEAAPTTTTKAKNAGTTPKKTTTKTSTPTSDPGDPDAPTCATADLKITVDDADGAAGHSIAPVHFRNTGADCWIEGYPTVVTGDGATAAKTPNGYGGGLADSTGEPSPYLLKKGETASAVIEALNANPDGTACQQITSIRVSPPKQRDSVKLTWSGGCAEFQVHPVIRGRTGQEG